MKNIKEGFLKLYNRSTLVTRMRIFYLVPIVPIVAIFIFTYANFWYSNKEYGDMINSVVKASKFSLDFKTDFDYETYMVIVGQKEFKQSKMREMIKSATGVVDDLSVLTTNGENKERIKLIYKYLENLKTYLNTIEENLQKEGTYDNNMQIWENDVQVGTALLQETFYQYTYYEVKSLESERNKQQSFFANATTISIIAFVVVGVLVLIISYYFNKLLRQVREEQISLRKAEFLVLQSQINPHFLYNTLDAITWLCESGEQNKVIKMVGYLSDFFRASLNHGKDIVKVSEDVWHVKSYLEIQKVRYQDILEYEINVDEKYGNILIPKLTLQPLVENALYHGIKNKRGGGKITITSYDDGENVSICVKDNGIGMDKKRLEEVRDGIMNKKLEENRVYGLYNVNERIHLHFGEKYGVSIESEEGEGTKTIIMLPVFPKSEKNKHK